MFQVSGRPVVMLRTCVVFAVPAYVAAVNPAAQKNKGYRGGYNYRIYHFRKRHYTCFLSSLKFTSSTSARLNL
jgi:hypothetical protein